ncbi:UBX domain-containing protein 7-like [Littorina saxatilis]|uniref:UBX domain-containing protein n=1 Tax=Littorina saxatilis TaxID=31220 RepID=A0AAN9GB49_9CAEN
MAANVSPVTEELVTQFCTVTGADRDTGEQLLSVCMGNLEMAIGMHMDQEEGARPSGSGTQARPSAGVGIEPGAGAGAAATASVEEELLNGIRAPIPQRHEVLVEEAPKIPGFRGGVRNTRRSVFDGFRDFQAEARQQESLMAAGRSVAKQHTLEDLFRPPIDLTHKGTFHTAREAGTSHKKWLLVNIQNVQEFTCQVLNRDIWSDITVKGLVKKHFVFWQVYHDSDEGKKYMQFYKVQSWPHVAVIDPVTGENLVTWNKVEPTSFADLMRDFVSEHPTIEDPEGPPAKRQKRNDSIVDASEEAQLEAAIQASLSANKLKAKPSTSATISAAAAIAACIDVDSSQSDVNSLISDDLETFTGSEDENSEQPHNNNSSGQGSSLQRRNFAAVSNRNAASSNLSASRLTDRAGAASSSSGAAASGVPSPLRHLLPPAAEDTSQPSTSGSSRDIVRVADESENDSQGFRESYSNTPNSVDILGSRSSEFHMLDSSSNSSRSGTVNVESDQDTLECERLGGGGGKGGEDAATSASPAWHRHYGDANDPSTNLLFRFPDGKKEQLSLPCSSKLEALFVFCSSKGFSGDSHELVVNFPRRSLSSLNPDTTVQEAKLHPQETVFVQAR